MGGRFWDGTFKCKVIEDEQQLVATMVYLDLTPFAAGACGTPEEGRHTSLEGRLGRDQRDGRDGREEPVAGDPGVEGEPGGRPGSLPRRRSCAAWLRPLDESLEDQRRRGQRAAPGGRAATDRARAGCVLAGLSLRVYLRVLDAVARKLREGKHRLAAGTVGIFTRLGLDPDAVAGAVLALRAEADRRGRAGG